MILPDGLWIPTLHSRRAMARRKGRREAADRGREAEWPVTLVPDSFRIVTADAHDVVLCGRISLFAYSRNFLRRIAASVSLRDDQAARFNPELFELSPEPNRAQD